MEWSFLTLATSNPICAHVTPAAPLATNLASSTLPTTLSVYAVKVEDHVEQHGSKVPCSLTDLLGLGFQFFNTPRPLLDGRGRIIAVLASRPAGENYDIAALAAAFYSIRNPGIKAQFPASMHKHCHGLFAAITIRLSYGKG
ncbi:hypothetical protein K438DRAFT_2025609 [Mycena galopus ATCC 62051]|nr:hypothetical protein K438DRAFT_2025609 [Mycena galopus ATCC 62051]